MVFLKGIRMEDKKIEAVKQWLKPRSGRGIQVFLGFANFSWQFIQEFSQIAIPLILMLMTSGGTKSKIWFNKGGVGVGSDIRARRGRSKIGGSGMDNVEVDGGEVEVDKVGKKVQNASKSKRTGGFSDYFTPGAKLVFTKLRQAFFKVLILYHFSPERHIQIEMDGSGYTIGEVLRQLTLNDSGQWHLVAFFSWMMIPAKTRYETHNGELLAIVEAFKTWRHNLEGSWHKVLMLTNHNNPRRFMDTKSLSSRQVCWAQELSYYHFRIDYHQGKANEAANPLSQYPQQSAKEEDTLHTENVKIFYCLQLSLVKVSGLSTSRLSHLYQILICEMTVFL